MTTVKLIIMILFTAFVVRAQDNPTAKSVDIEKISTQIAESDAQITHFSIIPEYEKNMPEHKKQVIEFYYGIYDGSQESKESLKFIQQLIKDDKRQGILKETSSLYLSDTQDSFQNDSLIDQIKDALPTQDTTHEIMPELDLALESNTRTPDSISIKPIKKIFKKISGKWAWSIIRTVSVTAGSSIALVASTNIPILRAVAVSLFPGVASGAITYFNNQYGQFLTNGKWASWLYKSQNPIAENWREFFGMGENKVARMKKLMTRHHKVFNRHLYETNPELFKKLVDHKVKNRILPKLKAPEEYLKWFFTEMGFVALTIEAPQISAGLIEYTGALSKAADIGVSSLKAVIAQGPADIAIQNRKYQKIDELERKLLSGDLKISNQSETLAQITRIKNKSLSATEALLPELERIENWARVRSTVLSVASTTAIGIDTLGFKAVSEPILITMAAGGAIYYKHVQGGFSLEKIKKFKLQNLNPIRPFMKALHKRWCITPFALPRY